MSPQNERGARVLFLPPGPSQRTPWFDDVLERVSMGGGLGLREKALGPGQLAQRQALRRIPGGRPEVKKKAHGTARTHQKDECHHDAPIGDREPVHEDVAGG